MNKKDLRIKILSGMICTGLVFSGASLSFAEESTKDSSNEKLATSMDIKVPMDKEKALQTKRSEMQSTLEAVIADGVNAKIITKDEGDKVLEYATVKFKGRSTESKRDKKCKDAKCQGEKGGLFNELVSEKILTQKKADALRERMHLKNTEQRHEKLQMGLNTLVINKVLTKEQSNKVKEAIMAREAERNENYKKTKDMTESERKAYMKKTKVSKVSPVKALVDNGTITKEQEKEIQKVWPQYKHGKHGGHHKK